jgi:hypothetical protein
MKGFLASLVGGLALFAPSGVCSQSFSTVQLSGFSGLDMPPSLRADFMTVLARPSQPFRFCQLGDIQIGMGLDGWKNDTHRMSLAAQQVNSQDFDFCIAVGDLTNDRSVSTQLLETD